MIIEEKYKISKDSDLLFAKIDISNRLKKEKPEYVNFFVFAIMELGTNLIKHAKKGEIWLLKEDEEFLLASLDEAEGIVDVDWALQKGNSTYHNSLGLGLYQLSVNSFFDFLIFTSKKEPHGTVILIKPKKLKNNLTVLSDNYIGLNVSGDFFVKKGKYFILGDASGHGMQANKSAEFIKKYFLNTLFSCSLSDMFFKDLHKELKKHSLRSAVLVAGEIGKNSLNVCGVGNIGMLTKQHNIIKKTSFKDGIIGEAFSSSSKYLYTLEKNSKFLMFSDGINEKIIYNIFKRSDDIYLAVVSAIFYSKRQDDKIILAIRS